MTGPTGPTGPTGAASASRRPRAVVVAMKPQLRGRIRRNVQTLLEMGAEVLVITVDGGKDFRLGLDDPHLHVRYERPLSVLTVLGHVAGRVQGRRWAATSPTAVRTASTTVTTDDPAVPRVPAWTGPAVAGAPPARPVRGRPDVHVVVRLVLRRAFGGLQALLRPWHRVTLWADFWRRSARSAQAWGPDLLVSSDVPGLVGAVAAARRSGVPHLHDCHELYLESTHLTPREKRLLAPVERHAMRRADVVTCVNRSIAEEYRARYGVRPVVVRNCAPRPVGRASADVRELAGLPASETVLLYQGGFAPGRGLEVLVRAAARLPTGTSLVLLGDGHHRAVLEDLAAASGAGGSVHFLPAVAPDLLLPLTATASVGVVPYQPVSMNNRLALPNKVFEYVAAGLPVVVSDSPELRRVVEDGRCGAVYDPYDETSLARALTEVLDPATYGATRAAARTYGEDNCWEVERELLVTALRGLGERLWPVPVPAGGPPSAGRPVR